jgi:RAB6A-GEF complex partner protein 1
MSISGDSLLVYCQDNTLSHFLIIPRDEDGTQQDSPRLVQLGQISFRGIIHSPTRVRAISWILSREHIGSAIVRTVC